MARRALVCGVQLHPSDRGVRESDRHVDHSGSQADANRHQLLSAQSGVFRRIDGRFQHFD